MSTWRGPALGGALATIALLATAAYAVRTEESATSTSATPTATPTPPTSTSTSATAFGGSLARPSASAATSTSTSAAAFGGSLARPSASAADAPPFSPTIAAVKSAARDRSPEGTRALIAALDASDPIAVVEAADALVARRSREGAVALAAVDLRRHEGAALAIVDALGKSAAADPANGDLVTRRLLALLAEEKARNTPESAAILLQIYEALGDGRDASAAPALERELEDASVGNAAKVVIVGALARIGAPSSRDALLRVRDALASAASDPFDEAVRRELLGAIDEALRG